MRRPDQTRQDRGAYLFTRPRENLIDYLRRYYPLWGDWHPSTVVTQHDLVEAILHFEYGGTDD